MKERLKILVFSMLVGSMLGAVDYLFGLFYSVYELRSEGLRVLAVSFVTGQAVYILLGLIFGVGTVVALALFRSVSSPERARKMSLSGKMLAGMFGAFIVLMLEAYTQVHSNWRLFLDFLFFVPIALAAGYGIDLAWQNYLKKFFAGSVQSILIITLALLAATALVTFWTLKLPVSTVGKFAMVAAFVAVFFAECLGGRVVLRKKSFVLDAIYVIVFLAFMALPYLAREKPAAYKSLGAAKHPLNVILIIADACRADALGVYGGKTPTPNIDRLAAEGVVFTNAYSQAPWTLPSMLSMMSSLYPSIFRYGQPYHADSSIEFFPERLKGYGYHTESIISNYLLAGSSGILQGLDESLVIHNRYRLQRLLFYPVAARTYYLARRLAGQSQMPDHVAMMTKMAEKFLGEPRAPFFLWLHYMNPHEPYDPPPKYLSQIKYQGFLRPPFYPNDPYYIQGDMTHPQEMDVKLGYIFLEPKDRQYIKDLYLAQLRYLDDQVGELVRQVKESKQGENTVIVFAADHGEEFWEHGNVGHGASLYDELLHVPLIIWGGGLRPAVVNEQIEMLDLAPTLAELLGIEKNPVWQGQSFYGALTQSEAINARTVFAEGPQRPEEMRGVRTGDYKMVIGLSTGGKWLFNLKDDPAERKNIYDAKPEVAKMLEGKIADWTAQNTSLRVQFQKRKLSPTEQKEFEERLRAAGYIK